MKKFIIIFLIIIFITVFAVGCGNQSPSVSNNNENSGEAESDQDDLTNNGDVDSPDLKDPDEGDKDLEDERGKTDKDNSNNNSANFDNNQDDDIINNNVKTSYNKDINYSPFTGKAIDKMYLEKAVMVSIENSPLARPQSGLNEASIIYEYMVEGGVTRFLALYWGEIPDKIGPVRSVRPYLIKTAEDYNALLLHAGASPQGFEILQSKDILHLDQIYNGKFYWRSSDRRPPHNLYTGSKTIGDYINTLTGQEYSSRFKFSRVSFAAGGDEKAKTINLRLWGGKVIQYIFDEDKNNYRRFYSEDRVPHLDSRGKQLQSENIIVKFTDTEVIDKEGRLDIQIEGKGKALVFKNGIVREGYWEKEPGEWTGFYEEDGSIIELNPGQTWIEVVPESAKVSYEE